MNDLNDKVAALEMGLNLLSEKDRQFADDLINGKWGFKKRGGLSPKQVYWVETLLARALGDGKKAPESVGDFSKVYALFAKAKQALKFPKIRLSVAGMPLMLSVAGPKSKAPGTVNVTDGEKFGQNKWYGRVDSAGKFEAVNKDYPEAADVVNVLVAFANDPLKVAKEYGKMTGYCCFCNKSLSDEQSVAAGFGPVCAKNFGLMVAYKEAEKVL